VQASGMKETQVWPQSAAPSSHHLFTPPAFNRAAAAEAAA
jgi:hypothetical protein